MARRSAFFSGLATSTGLGLLGICVCKRRMPTFTLSASWARGKPPSGAWWDVAPAEVSGDASIADKRAAYEEGLANQRWFG